MMSITSNLCITGRTDSTHQYEVLAHPSKITATITDTKTNVSKKIEATVSKLFWNNVWTNQDMHVTPQRSYSWPFAKQLFIELGVRSLTYPVSVSIRVDGIFNSQKYRIDFDWKQQNECHGSIENEEGMYKKAVLDLSLIPYAEVQNAFPHLEAVLEVKIDHVEKKSVLRVRLKSLVMSSAVQAPIESLSPFIFPEERPRIETILDVKDTKALVDYLETTESDFSEDILREIADAFTQKIRPSEGMIREVIALVSQMKPSDQSRIFTALFEHMDRPVIAEQALEGLIVILTSTRLQHLNNEETDSFRLTPASLVEIMKNFMGKLQDIHSQKDENTQLKKLLRVCVCLLEHMVMRSSGNVRKETHQAAYDAMDRFSKDPDVEIAYLAQYGIQLFSGISNDQTRSDEFFSRGYLIFQATTTIVGSISLSAPLATAQGIISAIPNIQAALTFQQGTQDWFLQLLVIRQMLLNQNPEYFLAFAGALKARYHEVRKEINLNDRFFVFGFIELMSEVLYFPYCKAGDTALRKAAVELLQDIYAQNTPDQKDLQQAFVVPEEADRKKIRLQAARALHSFISHPQQEIRSLVQTVIQQKNIIRPSQISMLIQPVDSSELFKKVAQEKFELLLAMQMIKTKLVNDPILQKEREHFIEFNATLENGTDEKPLKDRIHEFLKSDHQVLTIQGPEKAGEALGIKIFAEGLLKEYNQGDQYFPIYISLPELMNDNLTSFLGKKGIFPQHERMLKKRKVLFICDSYETTPFDTMSEERKQNLYENKGFAVWENAKVVFLYRSGYGNPQQFKPVQRTMQNLRISSPDTHVQEREEAVPEILEEQRTEGKIPSVADLTTLDADPIALTAFEEIEINPTTENLEPAMQEEQSSVQNEPVTAPLSTTDPITTEEDEIRKAFPGCLIGEAEWATHLGVVEKVPLPKGMLEILKQPCPIFKRGFFSFASDKKVGETHTLVLIPSTVNGQPLTLNSLVTLIKSKGHFSSTSSVDDCGNISNRNKLANLSHWVLMTKDVLPGSRNKSYQEQQAMVAALVRISGVFYEVPEVLDATVCIFMNYLALSGTYLFGDNPSTYTQCQEEFVVGSFNPKGLSFRYPIRIVNFGRDIVGDHGSVGVATLRRFVMSEEDEIRKVFPGCLIGEAEWATYLGVVEKTPLPEGMLDILRQPCPIFSGKKVGETHTLVLIPSRINGQPLTLNSLGTLIKSKGHFSSTKVGYAHMNYGMATEHGNKPVGSSHWALMTKDVLPESRNKSYQAQQSMVEALVRTSGSPYKVPKVLDATVCIFMNYLALSGTRLFGGASWAYTRCQEKIDYYPVIVGGFTSNGLNVTSNHDAADHIGIGGLREFMIEEYEIRKVFPGCLIGEAEWAAYLGVVEKTPLPEGMFDILRQPCPIFSGNKKVGETHTLVLVPSTVDGQPLTLNSLGTLIKSKGHFSNTKAGYAYYGMATEHGNKPVGSSHWVLMTKNVLPGSRDKSYQEQQAMVAALVRTSGAFYEVPEVLDATACIFMNYLALSGTRLFDFLGHTRCQEKVDDYPVVVGGFDLGGLKVASSCRNDYLFGVAGLRKFGP